MPIARAKGDKGKADLLFSRIVRHRGACELCGTTDYSVLTTAHIIGRRFNATRCLEDNAWCLCYRCHRRTEEWRHEFMQLVTDTIGMDRYDELVRLAHKGVKASPLFWTAEVERLSARCKELGIDTRRRVA
jgi:hypothetical protein